MMQKLLMAKKGLSLVALKNWKNSLLMLPCLSASLCKCLQKNLMMITLSLSKPKRFYAMSTVKRKTTMIG